MEQIIPVKENIEDYFGGYTKKTYKELIEEISTDEIDELYDYGCYLEQLKEKNMSKNMSKNVER